MGEVGEDGTPQTWARTRSSVAYASIAGLPSLLRSLGGPGLGCLRRDAVSCLSPQVTVAARAPREKIPACESPCDTQNTAPPGSPHRHAAHSAVGNPDLTTRMINEVR